MWRYKEGFKRDFLTPKLICSYQWSPILWRGGVRKGENFESSSFLVLDVDSGLNLGRAKKLFSEYEHIIATTKRHTESNNRFRVIIPFSRPIKSGREYSLNVKRAVSLYPFSDHACSDLARSYRPSLEVISTNHGKPWIVYDEPKTIHKGPRMYSQVRSRLPFAARDFMQNGAVKGERNTKAFKAACALLKAGFSFDETLKFLEDAPIDHSDLKENEMRRVVSSALKTLNL